MRHIEIGLLSQRTRRPVQRFFVASQANQDVGDPRHRASRIPGAELDHALKHRHGCSKVASPDMTSAGDEQDSDVVGIGVHRPQNSLQTLIILAPDGLQDKAAARQNDWIIAGHRNRGAGQFNALAPSSGLAASQPMVTRCS